MSLYRRYRPQTFSDIAGQRHVVTTLRRAVEQDRLAHAYLFAGSRGTGKTSLARILAKEILTRGIDDAALKERIIRGVEDDNLVDLIEIDAASNRGIDDVRSLLEKIQFTPVLAAAKVFIIDEVHMLTREAFNALLKTLEEPPPYAYFILATTELHKIPDTIQSRCQRFLFERIRQEDIVERLRHIAQQEKIDIEDEALAAIALHVEGGLRDAVSLLDQLQSLPHISADDVRQRTGTSGQEAVTELRAALDSADKAAVLRIMRTLEESAVPLEHVVRSLLMTLRTDLREAVGDNRPTDTLLHQTDTLLDALKNLRSAPLPAMVLESALLSLCATAPSSSAARDDRSSESSPSSPSSSSSHPPAPPAPPSSAPSTPPSPTIAAAEADAPSPLSLHALRAAWPDIIQHAEPPYVRMSLKNGHVHAVENDTVILRFPSAFHRTKAAAPEGGANVEQELARRFGRPLTIKYEMDAGTDANAGEGDVDLASAVSDVF